MFGRRLGYLLLMTAAVGGAPRAQPLFRDDFESGSFSAWRAEVPYPGATLSVDPAAAHRGKFGFRYLDMAGTPGSGAQGYLSADVSPQANASVRFWFRLTQDNGLGNIYPLLAGGDLSGSYSLAALLVSLPRGGLAVGTSLADGGYDTAAAPPGVPAAGEGWHLIEVRLMGLGTSTATREVWLDGVPEIQGPPLDLARAQFLLQGFALGCPYSDDARSAGTYDFDDVRVSTELEPDRLNFLGPTTLSRQACVPQAVVLQDADGVPRAASEDVPVQLAVSDGTGAFYSDDACTAALSALLLPVGQARAKVYVQAGSQGTVVMRASSVDYLPATAQLSVGPGGLSPRYALSCTSSGTNDVRIWMTLFTGAVILRARGRSSRAGSAPGARRRTPRRG